MTEMFLDETWLAAAKRLGQNHEIFRETLDNMNTTPAPVFKPLNRAQIEELAIIRQASAVLQRKKEEDTQMFEEPTILNEVGRKGV